MNNRFYSYKRSVSHRISILLLVFSTLTILAACAAAINKTVTSQNYGISFSEKAEVPNVVFVTISQSEMRYLRGNYQRVTSVAVECVVRFCDLIGMLYDNDIATRPDWKTCISKFSQDIRNIQSQHPNDDGDVTFSYAVSTMNARHWLIATGMGGLASGVNRNSFYQRYDGILAFLSKMKLNQ